MEIKKKIRTQDKNLIRFTSETAKENGRKGGLKSKRKKPDTKLLELAESIVSQDGKTDLDLINEKVIELAKQGDPVMTKIFYERVFGKPRETLSLERVTYDNNFRENIQMIKDEILELEREVSTDEMKIKDKT